LTDSPQRPSPSPESDRKVLGELFREAIGYENGMIRTLIDLRKNPRGVLEGYSSGDRRYISPFRLLMAGLTLWILLNSFLIDWYAVWSSMMEGVITADVKLIGWLKKLDPAGEEALRNKLVADGSMELYCKFAGDLFSRWFVPFTLISIVAGSILFVRRNRALGIGLRETMYVMSYSVGASLPTYLVMSLAFSFNVWVGLVISLILSALSFIGQSSLMSYAPVRSFFPENGKAIEAKITKSIMMVIAVTMSITIFTYFAYFAILK